MLKMRLTDGEVEACRQKAVARVEAFVSTLNGKTDREKFDALKAEFDRVADTTSRLSENLDPDKLPARLKADEQIRREKPDAQKDPSLRDSLPGIMRMTIRGQQEMEAIRLKMEECLNEEGDPLARVNGTSEIFGYCSGRVQREISFIRVGMDFLKGENGTVPADCPKREECELIPEQCNNPSVSSLTARLGQFFAAFMIIPDMIETICQTAL